MEASLKTLDVGGIPTRYLELGGGPREVVFMPGGARSGLWRPSPWVWEMNLAAHAPHARAMAVEVPSACAAEGIEALVRHLGAFCEAMGSRRPHLVGHDEAGLAALLLALRQPESCASVTVVGSCAAPMGDGLPNLSLAAPPFPLLSRTSQAWALERSSYSHHHVALGHCLDEAVRLADSEGSGESPPAATALRASLAIAKSEVYARLREGLKVPVQLVWGLQDPLVPMENALALFGLVRERQKEAQLKVINRAGNLPFREHPDAFDRMLKSFVLAC